jgi:hypothetical protein
VNKNKRKKRNRYAHPQYGALARLKIELSKELLVPRVLATAQKLMRSF